MTGRQRTIDVETVTGPAALTFTSESELGSMAATFEECHRSYLETTNPFDGDEWKYYESVKGQPKLCRTHGKLKDDTGFPRGISMWEPHCFPKTLLDKRNGATVKCKKLKSAAFLPTEFVVVRDRTYSASIAGGNVSFTHYLLTPSGQFQESAINAARSNIIADDCVFEAGAESHELSVIDFDDCERAVGPVYAAQCALKSFANDQNSSVGEQCDALVLYAWLGSLEATIDELVDLSPWASEILLACLKKYDPSFPNNSNFLMNVGDAVDSLQYQLERFYSVHSEP